MINLSVFFKREGFRKYQMKKYMKIKWLFYIAITSLPIVFYMTDIGPLLSNMKNTVFSFYIESPPKYVIIFDGGSTGTRLHVFTFTNNTSGLLILKNEYFKEIKPGLSSFADNPKNAAIRIINLLEDAKSIIPSNNWNVTPVALKATAGLRLLSKHSSDSILQEVSKAFQQSPFVSGENSVSILDGESEGLYAWYTLNFLLGKLSDLKGSIAALDLGGGSTQVTFLPLNLDSLASSPKEYIVTTKVHNKPFAIYSHSYLGLGLMAARMVIFRINDNKELSIDGTNNTILTSCLSPQTKISWRQDRKEYIIIGSTEGRYGFENCYNKAVLFLSDTVHQPDELSKHEVYALSYYFERAVELGIIGENGGYSTVDTFVEACKAACNVMKPMKAFLCLDCSYISALLLHGLAFNKDKEIMFVNQINGVEASWALGAAFGMIL